MGGFNTLTPYSKGIVAVNKEPNTDIIYVWPMKILPMVDGEILDAAEPYSADVVDSFGRRRRITAETTNTLKCKYKPNNPNLMTAPDVRRGAEVMIYRDSVSDYFYWETISNTKNYQKLEEVTLGFSNTQKEDESADMQNTWTQTISTRRKVVDLIKTTKSDGEKWAYYIGLTAKEGFIEIKDDIGNMIRLDSPNNTIRLQNGAGTFLELNQTKIEWGCETYVGNAKSSMEETSPNKTGTYSSGLNTTSPTHSHSGNYSIAGGISSAPGSGGSGMSMQGSMNLIGDINQSGTTTINGDAVIGGISFLGHRHSETQSVTGPPMM